MRRGRQALLIGSTILASWLGMQAIHELGHVVGAWVTGGSVERVVLHPLTISRTDLADNPRPLFVVWAGPLVGVVVPVILWMIVARWSWSFLLRFFAGFCLIVNGLYIGVGSFDGVGDCGDMLRHGSDRWQLWLFGAVTSPVGLWMWHGQGPHFGLGKGNGQVTRGATIAAVLTAFALLAMGFALGGE